MIILNQKHQKIIIKLKQTLIKPKEKGKDSSKYLLRLDPGNNFKRQKKSINDEVLFEKNYNLTKTQIIKKCKTNSTNTFLENLELEPSNVLIDVR